MCYYYPVVFDIVGLITHVYQKSDIYRYNWKVHRPLISIRDNQKFHEEDYEKEDVSFSVI